MVSRPQAGILVPIMARTLIFDGWRLICPVKHVSYEVIAAVVVVVGCCRLWLLLVVVGCFFCEHFQVSLF
jgi:hypothetical protein